MSDPTPIEKPAAEAAAGDSRPLRKRRSAPAPTREQSRRQSLLVQAAWRHFGEAEPMIAFLNSRNDALQGQPLHLAIESDDGLERVERLLQHLTLKA